MRKCAAAPPPPPPPPPTTTTTTTTTTITTTTRSRDSALSEWRLTCLREVVKLLNGRLLLGTRG